MGDIFFKPAILQTANGSSKVRRANKSKWQKLSIDLWHELLLLKGDFTYFVLWRKYDRYGSILTTKIDIISHENNLWCKFYTKINRGE